MNKLLNKITFITGSTKNSGKTTFWNYALGELRAKKVRDVAYMSIGVDGEAFDQIFGHKKPRICARTGDLVVTTEAALKATEASFKIIKKFPFATILGRPALVKITAPGLIEIVGPGNNTQLGQILRYVCKNARAKTILVDGAVNRVTQVASLGDAQFVYTVKVERARIQSAADEVKRIYELSRVPCHYTPNTPNDVFLIKGALTPAKAAKIPAGIRGVIVEDFTKVFLNYKELANFQRRHRMFYKTAFKLVLIVANLFDVEKKEFAPFIGRSIPSQKIVYKVL